MNQTNTRGPAKLAVLPISYEVQGQLIPARLTILERQTFVLGLGVPKPQAAVFAMQDRAASLIGVLGSLIAQTGDAALIAKAERLTAGWNDECDAFFHIR